MGQRRRARADEYAERVNAAVALLGEGSPADAARALATGHAISERQARRYVQGALERPEGVAVPERTAVFTVKLPVDVIAALRRHVRFSGRRSARRSPKRCALISITPTSAAVARRVEIEYVGDRLAGARLAQAYELLVPGRRRSTTSPHELKEERDGPDTAAAAAAPAAAAEQDRRDLRAGVLRAPAPGRDDQEPDHRAA